MLRKWDVQWCWNPWLSVGFHFDHTDPGLTLHLPGVILSLGRLKQPGFRTGTAHILEDESIVEVQRQMAGDSKEGDALHTDTEEAVDG